MTLAEIDDIELLRKAALLLQEDNKKLTKLLAQLKRKLHQLESGDPEQLKLQIAGLEQQLAQRNHLLFGDKSEKRSGGEAKAEKPTQTGHGRRAQPLLPEIAQVPRGQRIVGTRRLRRGFALHCGAWVRLG